MNNKICSKCNWENRPEAKFCKNCGAKLVTIPSPVITKLVRLVILPVLLAVLAATGYYAFLYKHAVKEVQRKAGKEQVREEPLEMMPSTPKRLQGIGSLYIASEPIGAKVIVDGEEKGDTPVTLKEIQAGEHVLRIVKEGYEPWEKLEVVQSNSVTRVETKLKKAEAVLTVFTKPEEAEIYLDGVLKGRSPLTIKIPWGQYKLAVDKDWYLPYAEDVALKANEVKRADITLKQCGELMIESTPPGAEVFLDGVSKGITPLKIKQTPVGSHTVGLRLTNFVPFEDTMQVLHRQVCKIQKILESITLFEGRSEVHKNERWTKSFELVDPMGKRFRLDIEVKLLDVGIVRERPHIGGYRDTENAKRPACELRIKLNGEIIEAKDFSYDDLVLRREVSVKHYPFSCEILLWGDTEYHSGTGKFAYGWVELAVVTVEVKVVRKDYS